MENSNTNPDIEEDDVEELDICSLCGELGADKYPHPCHWPGEAVPESRFVHAECEREECARAFKEFRNRVGENGIKDFLRYC